MSTRTNLWLMLLGSLVCALSSATCGNRVRIGAEVLIEKNLGLLANKRVGIICNQTSLLPNGTHIVDTLIRRGVNVTTLFGPEHGIRGMSAAGENVESAADGRTGLPMYSLYGKVKKPTAQMLANVDAIVFDIQDVGARFYTYASTMAYAMSAAAENGKKFIVLDRPNPVNGVDIEGPVLDTAFRSFVGLFPIPIRHGMTLGELARMMIGEKWLGGQSNVDLTVVPLEGWNRTMWYDELGLPWVSPSPNMKSLQTAAVYPGTCLIEGSNISEGRGTQHPFEYIGAPWLNGDSLCSAMNALHIPGVQFEPIEFMPEADSAAAVNPKFRNEQCKGVYLHVLDRSSFRPVATAVRLLKVIHELYGDKLQFRAAAFDQLAGDSVLRTTLLANTLHLDTLLSDGPGRLFEEKRKKYLLYQ